MKQIKKVAIIGLGYVGLPTMVAIAKTKLFEVIGYDLDKNKIELIKKGNNPIEDKEVSIYLRDNKLNVFSKESALKDSDVFIICVPTPITEDFEPDYSIVESAIKCVSKYLKKGSHIVLESTVSPGTCEERLIPILESKAKFKVGKDINLAHCPERINPGDPRWNISNITEI
jgi:nucleotide sugar dehydrogenase